MVYNLCRCSELAESEEHLLFRHHYWPLSDSSHDKGGNFVHEKVQEKDPYKHYKHVSIAMFAVLQFL